jgi:predicted transcriptional regulator
METTTKKIVELATILDVHSCFRQPMDQPSAIRRRPTRAELSLLKVLWKHGPSTVREVHDALPSANNGYTTVLKLLQIMKDKGLVTRDESKRAHVYSAVRNRKQTQREMLRDFLDNVYGGSATQLAEQALDAARQVDEHEVARLKRSLEELEHRV